MSGSLHPELSIILHYPNANNFIILVQKDINSEQAKLSSHIFSGTPYQQPHNSDSDSLWPTIYVKCSRTHGVTAKPLCNFTPLCLWRQIELHICIFAFITCQANRPYVRYIIALFCKKGDNPHNINCTGEEKKTDFSRNSHLYYKWTMWAVKMKMITSFFTKWRRCAYFVNYFFGFCGSVVCFVNVSYMANQMCTSISSKTFPEAFWIQQKFNKLSHTYLRSSCKAHVVFQRKRRTDRQSQPHLYQFYCLTF